MEMENQSRADLALPNPEESSSVPKTELSEVTLHDLKSTSKSSPKHTWLTFLKKELEFLGVTQILIGFLCLCFGLIVCIIINISDFEEFFSSFNAGYPFWGALFFATSGLLSIISEKKNTKYLARGSLGANTVSSIAAVAGIIILITNLKNISVYIDNCYEFYEANYCFMASFSTEIMAMMLFLTILGFCSAMSVIIYSVGEEIKRNKVPDERLYEELNIYSPIYSELEDRPEVPPPSNL
ncbi:high affinity immunoglobulin epsilon receptor subunit beta [Tupaia chinensis]|uniref:high affinity immunoglobulin epsilon receptor subunit beta n=1 Tax=Tupaia chinensis TaxID=246437 RepID=UPI0003C8E5A3|nr:high affinity immunoglobulin epsilon receptor subunit beta [Tupaia chinensis]